MGLQDRFTAKRLQDYLIEIATSKFGILRAALQTRTSVCQVLDEQRYNYATEVYSSIEFWGDNNISYCTRIIAELFN